MVEYLIQYFKTTSQLFLSEVLDSNLNHKGELKVIDDWVAVALAVLVYDSALIFVVKGWKV
jgi:hypothetical protein